MEVKVTYWATKWYSKKQNNQLSAKQTSPHLLSELWPCCFLEISLVWASWLCMCPEHRRLCFCIFLLLLMSDCSVEPLNICLDKSQFHFSQDFKSDGRRKKSRYYMSAPCCCWVPFSSLEIKNVHSHKLERRLVLPFYSKDELHIAHEVWNVLIKQCKPLTLHHITLSRKQTVTPESSRWP